MKKLISIFTVLTLLAALSVSAAAEGSSAGNYGTVIGDGYVSAEIGDQDIIWLYENSDSGVWFGIDNSKGVFEPGSRLSTRWITQEESAEWAETLDLEELGDYRLQYLIEVTNPDGTPCDIPEDAALLVQVGAGWSPETVEGCFATADGGAIGDIALCQMGFPGGVDTFASVPLPGETDEQILSGTINNSYNTGDVIGQSSGGVILVGGICGENDGGHSENGYYGGVGSIFSGSASWLTVVALVEFGAIVGLVIGLFAKRKKN